MRVKSGEPIKGNSSKKKFRWRFKATATTTIQRSKSLITNNCSEKWLKTSDLVDEHFLASGSFGKIYGATLLPYRLDVAVKKLPATKHHLATVMREAVVLKRARHRNVVSMLGMANNFLHDELWIVTELLNGGTLRVYCTGDSDLDPINKLHVSIDCWAALTYLHTQAKITHKDLKPENVLLHRQAGGKIMAKLCDFGLAKLKEDGMETQTTSVVGTAMYFPPEYVDGVRNAEKADVYSMGATLCELYSHTYFWHNLCTKKPLTYPQIIAKLLIVWQRLQKNNLTEIDVPSGIRQLNCTSWIRRQLIKAVAYNRSRRPTAAQLHRRFKMALHNERLGVKGQ